MTKLNDAFKPKEVEVEAADDKPAVTQEAPKPAAPAGPAV